MPRVIHNLEKRRERMKKLIWLRLVGAIVVSLTAGSVAMAAAPDMGAKSIGSGNYYSSHPLYFLLVDNITV